MNNATLESILAMFFVLCVIFIPGIIVVTMYPDWCAHQILTFGHWMQTVINHYATTHRW